MEKKMSINIDLTKEKYIDIIENLDFFYGDNLIATAELRNEKSKELQEKDLESYKQKLNCLKQLIKEHFELVELLKKHDLENLSIKELDTWFDRSLWHVNKVNELSNQLVELSRVANSKQEIIDLYLESVETDILGDTPIQMINNDVEKKILNEANKYVYSIGYKIKFNRNQMIEMLEMYLNKPLKFEELKENMVVWDNKRKMFIKIFDTATLEENCFSFEVFGWEVPIYDEQFEKNRFYRREVKK